MLRGLQLIVTEALARSRQRTIGTDFEQVVEQGSAAGVPGDGGRHSLDVVEHAIDKAVALAYIDFDRRLCARSPVRGLSFGFSCISICSCRRSS